MRFMKTYIAFYFSLVLALTLAFPASASEQSGTSEEHVTSGAWVKQGDTWVYEMDLTPGVWYYWEDNIPGYTSDAKKEDGKKTAQSDREIVVTNTQELDYGSLTLGKMVAGTAGETGPVSEFEFTVTLKGDYIKGIQMFGDYTFHDGVTHLKLAGGDSITIDKLPAGTAYTITEEYVPRYSAEITSSETVSGGTATTTNSENRTASGTIDKDGVDSIHYTNTYTPPTEEEIKTNSFHITKTVSGNAEIKDRNFTLKLAFQGLEAEKEYQVTRVGVGAADTFTSDRDGDADVTVMIQDGETLTVENLPVGAAYRITELGGDYVASYQITDANKLNLIHTSAGSSGVKDTPLSTGKETVDEGENITVAFTNEFFRVQKLHLTKKVLDASGAELSTPEKFRFVMEFNKVPSSGFDSSVGFIKAEDGYASVEVLLSGGETIDFSGIPVGTTWQIKEVGNDYLPSYEYQQKPETAEVTEAVAKTGENTDPRKDLSTALETINEGEDTTVTFTNKRSQEEPKTLTLKKLVTGNFGNRSKAFPFTITLMAKDGTPLSGTFPCEGKVSRLILNEKGQAVVSLSHGESVTIQEIPADAQYTVCETDSGGYQATVTDVGETSTRKLEAANALTDSDAKTPEATGSMNGENHTVTFTNTKGFVVPTGVLMSVAPYVLIGGAIFVFLVVRGVSRKKKK